MALEPMTVSAGADENPELREMTWRFWTSVVLGIPLVAFAMLRMSSWLHFIPPHLGNWIEFALATPIVLWCGWPFFQRGWASVKFRSPNMFTLIAMGVGVAYIFSAVATIVAADIPAVHAQDGRTARGLLRSRRGDHRSRAAWAGVWNCAPAAAPAAPFAHCSISRRRWRASCAKTVANTMFHSIR